jgi:molybdopterin synthase sulfur carrier subunit
MQVRVFANLREICGGPSIEMVADNKTVLEILEEMVKKFPPLEDEIFTEKRTLKEFVHVFINGQNIIHKDGLQTKVKEEDQFALFPPVAGG